MHLWAARLSASITSAIIRIWALAPAASCLWARALINFWCPNAVQQQQCLFPFNCLSSSVCTWLISCAINASATSTMNYWMLCESFHLAVLASSSICVLLENTAQQLCVFWRGNWRFLSLDFKLGGVNPEARQSTDYWKFSIITVI